MQRSIKEQKILKKLGISDFRHMTKDKIVKFASMFTRKKELIWRGSVHLLEYGWSRFLRKFKKNQSHMVGISKFRGSTRQPKSFCIFK